MRRVFAVCVWLAIAGCSSSTAVVTPSPSPSHSPAAAAVAVAGGCGTTQVYERGEPDWLTRAGDNNNPNGLPYFIASPPIAAGFIFGYPLRSGAPSNPNNKILWVVGVPRDGNDLHVSGHPMDAATPTIDLRFPADSEPGEIYPSTVDVPSAGCWHFDLAWGPNQASADLLYT
jgi:hypothetical protein